MTLALPPVVYSRSIVPYRLQGQHCDTSDMVTGVSSGVVQGGNVRESTVAKMREEVEANALYEKAAALARASGSHRMLKSCPSSRSLATQKSMSLHQLVEKHFTNAASLSEQLTAPAENTDQPHGDLAAMHLQDKDMARSPSKHTMHTCRLSTEQPLERPDQQAWQPDMMGREAQMLLGPYKPPAANTCCDPPIETTKQPKVADVGEAVLVEEKYHRAGREVLGQHVDAAAAALAAKERAKHRMKVEKLHLGYTPLKHEAGSLQHAAESDVSSCSQLGYCTAAPHRFQYASAI